MKRLFAMALCLLLVLTACGGTGDGPSQVAMGRYMETALSLPEGLDTLTAMDQVGNTVYIFGSTVEAVEAEGGDYYTSFYRIWASDDFGDSWRTLDYPWLEELNEYGVHHAHIAAEDDILIYCQEFVADDPEAPEGGYRTGYTVNNLFQADKGELVPIDLGGYFDEQSPVEMRRTERGDLLINSGWSIDQVDPATGRVLADYVADDNIRWGSYLTVGDTLAIADEAGIQLYDLATGEPTVLIPYAVPIVKDEIFTYSYPTRLTALTESRIGDALYYIDESGLYRALLDGSITERLMDGELSSIGLPTLMTTYLFEDEAGRFLVLCRDGDRNPSLFRYSFDASVSTLPTQEIRIYALYDSSTVRQAIGQFQQQNTDVKVTFDVGLGDDSQITTSDALRTLSTELLAGHGPDLLVLDGLPVNSYINQGVLADLSSRYTTRIEAGELLTGVAGAYRTASGLYGIPVRFIVPMAQGIDAAHIDSLEAMLAFMETADYPDTAVAADNMVDRFYNLRSPFWFMENGSLDTEAFARDLDILGKMADIKRPLADPRDDGWVKDNFGSLWIAALDLFGSDIRFEFAYITSFGDLLPSIAIAEQENKHGELADLPRLFDDSGVFVPSTSVGVNQSSTKQALALDFLDCLLSYDVQICDFGDGFAVNYEALMGSTATPADGGHAAVGGGDSDNLIIINYSWPDEALLQGYVEQFKSLHVPSVNGDVVRGIIVDETAGFLRGESTLDDTVAALEAKLNIYLSE